MSIFKIKSFIIITRLGLFVRSLLFCYRINFINRKYLFRYIFMIGPESLGIVLLTASFIGIVFTLQVVKEFLYLNVSSSIGAILSLAFIRELSPVLTTVILTGRIGSSFAAELATMKITEQIDALYLLRVEPIFYLILPRLIACIFMLPCLNIIFMLTSLSSSIFTCFIFYNIHPYTFLYSVFVALSFKDIFKSIIKTVCFGLTISVVSCSFGLTVEGGSRGVGQATTSAVVFTLLLVFILDCILTYLLFNQAGSIIKRI